MSLHRAVRPWARIVQVGILPPDATALLASDIDPGSLISHEFDLVDAELAFNTASDRSTASTVLLRMTPGADD